MFIGTPNRVRRGDRESVRGAIFTSQTSTVTEAPSDEIDDMDSELPRVTQCVTLTTLALPAAI